MASRTHLTDDAVKQALQEYVEHKLDIKAVAHMLMLSEAGARTLLQGRSWVHIPRPEGFAYPWPDQRQPTRRLGEERVCQALKDYQEQGWNVNRLAEELAIKQSHARDLIQGYLYKGIQRPKELKYRRYVDDRADEIQKALELYHQNQWTSTQLAQHLKCGRAFAAMILSGAAYKNVPRPEGFVYRRYAMTNTPSDSVAEGSGPAAGTKKKSSSTN